jgi:8-oxo-dGTP pyrophosphatase MutT (NUDIX family)
MKLALDEAALATAPNSAMPMAKRRGMVRDAEWEESKHPRGQPGNAGQFGSGGGEKQTVSESLSSSQKEAQKISAKTWSHGTFADFEKFSKTNDIGIHFGTPDQVDFRRGGVFGTPGGRVISAKLHVRNTIRLPDHSWDTPETLAQALKNFDTDGVLKKSADDWGRLKKTYADEDLPTKEYRAQKAQIADATLAAKQKAMLLGRQALERAGYDSVVYTNEVEGSGRYNEQGRYVRDDSVIVLDPENIEILKQASDAAGDTVQAAGLIVLTPTGHALFLQRSDKGDQAGTWCWPAGKIEAGEDPSEAAIRETIEETGWTPAGEIKEVESPRSDAEVAFTTFAVLADEPFVAKLDDEHIAFAWAPLTDPPMPLHSGVEAMLRDLGDSDVGEDAKFEESKHPWDQDGKFGSGGGGSEQSESRVNFRGSLPKTRGGETSKFDEYEHSDGRIFNYDVHYDAEGGATIANITLQTEVNGEEGSFPAHEHVTRSELAAVMRGISAQENEVLAERKVEQGKDAANEASVTELHATIKHPPKPTVGGERSIDVSMSRGGAGASLKEAPKARRNTTTTHDEEVAQDERLALDRASVREKDQDGKLFVALSNLTMAAVNPYLGSEVPGAEELGLDPNRIYQLFRPPEELEKAVSTFNSLPVLSVHCPVFSSDYAEQAQKYVIGTTGTDAVWEEPYIKNSLSIWDGEAVRLIESGEKQQISSGYHYIPILEPGIYKNQKYDIKMVDIRANHCAIVVEGRAGKTVVVGDSQDRLWFLIESSILKLR